MSELCQKCKKNPVYQHKGRPGVLCATCMVKAFAELISEPEPGTTATCDVCGMTIAYSAGGFWRHVVRNWQCETATPEPSSWLDEETQEFVEWLQDVQ